MKLLFDGENAFFSERVPASPQSLVIRLPEKASLFCNGICYFPKGSFVKLPEHALRLGTNLLALRIENRLFSTESLRFDGKLVYPDGLSHDGMLLRQHERTASLEDTVAKLEARISALEQKNSAHMLFS